MPKLSVRLLVLLYYGPVFPSTVGRHAVCNFRDRVIGLRADCVPTAVSLLLSRAGCCLCTAFRLFRRYPVGKRVRAHASKPGTTKPDFSAGELA